MRGAGRAAAVVTFVLALVGASTGLVDWLDDRRVTLRLSADRYSGPVGGPLRFAIDNRSRRGVSLHGGWVRAEGRRVPLPRLRAGTYVWAIQVDGETVASGVFDTPCPSLLAAGRDPIARCTPRTPPFSGKEPGLP